MKKAIFVAATGQNVGKTTLCLGIMAALRERFSKVGFIKPVGQQHIAINDRIVVDKDVALFKNYFHLDFAYEQMSPVILPAGFTRSFLDGKIDSLKLKRSIEIAFEKISKHSSFTLVEGTGHVGVGSLVHLSNAAVAASLKLEVIIIASGGLGSAYDELALNIELCRAHHVNVKGVILNRVLQNKREMIEHYFPKALKQWNIPLIGCVPFHEFLSLPTLLDFAALFKTTLIAGHNQQSCHFPHHRLVAGSVEAFEQELLKDNELIITPATREEIILSVITHYLRHKKTSVQALILTGRHAPSSYIIDQIKQADLPALYAPLCSYEAMESITSFVAKIRSEDSLKIAQAIELTEKNLDIDQILA